MTMMTTTTRSTTARTATTEPSVVRHLCRTAPIVALLLIVGACSGSSAEDQATTTSAVSIQVDDVRATSTAVARTEDLVVADQAGEIAVAETTVPLDSPGDALLTALSGLGTSYTFASDVTTSSGDSVIVAGSRVGDGLQYRVEAGGAVIDVISVGGQTWVLEDGSTEWVDAGPVASGDPLGPLAQPIDVSYGPASNSTLRATYAGAALGLDVDELVDVAIAYDGTSMSFTSTSAALRLTTTLLRSDALAQILPPVS